MRTSDVRRERELRRRKEYREVVIHAAERVILRKSYSAMTMDDVAREAHLSKATVYKYVAGKGALLAEIMGHQIESVRALAAGIVAGPGSAAERLGGLVRVVLQNSEDTRHFNRILAMDKAMLRLMRVFHHPAGRTGGVSPADRKIPAMLRQKRREIVDLGARVLREGIAAGEFRSMDTDRASAFIEAVLQGYTHMRFWEGDAPLSPTAAADLTRFIIEGIRAPQRPGKEI